MQPPHASRAPATVSATRALGELAAVFLKLGVIGFGGPAAHIALMRDEVVGRRGWLSDEEFLDLVGATNLIPGPNSTEMAIHIGRRRGGWPGLVVAGVCFIAPAVAIVLALAWAYVEFGATPEASRLLYGIKPVIIAIVAQALWSLGRAAVKDAYLAALGVAVLALYLAGANELALLFAAGAVVMAARNAGLAWALVPAAGAAVPTGAIFLTFLKIGSVIYGSGYVLLAFLRADFVERLRWLTDRQLLDAVAVGQFTPGPVFTTATFIGYLLGGVPAALAATVGIFLPGFVFVAASHSLIPRLRRSAWAGAFLDGVNVASLALMAGVAWHLGRAAIVDPLTLVVAGLAAVLLFRFRANSAWLVAGGALVGLASLVAR